VSGVAITTGTPVLSRARLKYRALHSVVQVFDFSFPHGVGLPDCFPAAAGLAGHPAPAQGRARWGS